MSRRHFIKQSGILAGGLLLSNQMVQAFAGSAEKINIGIIGCGDRGTGIMNMLKDLTDRFSVTAICDGLDFRLENAKKLFLLPTLKCIKIITSYLMINLYRQW